MVTESASIPVEHIKAIVARHYRMSVKRLVSEERTTEVTKARFIAIALSRELTTLSTPLLGRRFGDRDHATILHAIKQANARFREEMGHVCAIVQASYAAYHADVMGGAEKLFWLMLFACDDVRKRKEQPPAPKPVFVPRKAIPARVIAPAPRHGNVTASLMGDPGARSARVDRGEMSAGNV